MWTYMPRGAWHCFERYHNGAAPHVSCSDTERGMSAHHDR